MPIYRYARGSTFAMWRNVRRLLQRVAAGPNRAAHAFHSAAKLSLVVSRLQTYMLAEIFTRANVMFSPVSVSLSVKNY